jgi:O-antigen/teichoic acid export membrane protein
VAEKLKNISTLISQEIKKLFKSKFGKSVLMISGGTIFAQALSTFLSPFITRLYLPQEFGTLSLFVSIITIIIFSTTFSYDVAIPVADDEHKAVNVLSLCLLILFSTTVLLTVMLFFFGEGALNYFNAGGLIKYKYLIPLGFITTGLYTVLSQWAIRKKDFKSISITKYSQSIAGNITKNYSWIFIFWNNRSFNRSNIEIRCRNFNTD